MKKAYDATGARSYVYARTLGICRHQPVDNSTDVLRYDHIAQRKSVDHFEEDGSWNFVLPIIFVASSVVTIIGITEIVRRIGGIFG